MMPGAAHLASGARAEDAALAWLEGRGLRCLQRNFRCRLGEIDLVMRDGDTLVFVEVRYRHSSTMPGALESIGPAKRRRLVCAAGLYLAWHPALATLPARFDVIAIDRRPGADNRLQWIADAFRPGD